jgi:hypothetical protein
MCQLEEVERCMPTRPIPYTVHGLSVRECGGT